MVGYNHAFISYGRKESKHFASKLNEQLIQKELEVWFDKDDIPASTFYQNEIDKGIERSDNFIYIIAPHSVQSDYCNLELEYAIKLNKRIIPILHIQPDGKKIHPTVQKINWIYGREELDENKPLEEWNAIDDFDTVINQIIEVIEEDKSYYKKHKITLSKALSWEREGFPDSYLLRGFNLEQSQIWLEQGKKRELHQPLEIQDKFIEASQEKKGSLRPEVFISYSTQDSNEIANQLNNRIQLNGITTWFDQESIASGENFQKEIYKGIEESNVFIFIISEKSIISEYCEGEINHALQFNKKIITIRANEVEKLPKSIKEVQWIDFVGKPFYNAFSELIRALTVDRAYTQKLSTLLNKALEWENNDRPDDLVLRGREYENIQEWLDEIIELKKSPEPPQVLIDYISTAKDLFEKNQKIAQYNNLKNEALKVFVRPYLIQKKKELEQKIEKSERELLNKKHSYPKRGNIEDYDLRQEINTIENFINEGGKWHPQPSKWTGDTGVEFDYMCIHTFPCCGKQVAGDATPSQFREDGCEDAPV